MTGHIRGAYRGWADRVYWRLVAGLAPGLLNSHHAYARALASEVERASQWLDLGCGHDFLPPFVSPQRLQEARSRCVSVGIDADGDALVNIAVFGIGCGAISSACRSRRGCSTSPRQTW